MSYTFAYSYTVTDIETVVRRFTADIVMIAQSSGAITEAKARAYAHDVEALAKKNYLEKVDLTLFSGEIEICATQYVVDTSVGDLAMSRPGESCGRVCTIRICGSFLATRTIMTRLQGRR